MILRTRRKIGLLAALLLCLFMPPLPASSEHTDDAVRILLAGNSILYTNNLPTVLTAISKANDKHLVVDMFAQGGATVADLLASDAVTSAITDGAYGIVIFHDRGGNAFACDSPGDACEEMIDDHRRMAELIRDAGATPWLLGTYQPAHVSARLTKNEKHIAEKIGVAHIEISDTWNRIKEATSELPWLAEDGMHPGRALTALMATEIYREIFSSYPLPSRLSTTSPLYVPREKLRNIVALEDQARGAEQEILSEAQFRMMIQMFSNL